MSTPTPKGLTPKQALVAHIIQHHKGRLAGYGIDVDPDTRSTFKALSGGHAQEHYRYTTSHYHEGANTGPNERPPGWYTGEGAVLRR